MTEENGGWSEYGKLVLNELKRLNASIDSLHTDFNLLQRSWSDDLTKVRAEAIIKSETLKSDIETVNRELSVKIGQLQIKSGVWGAAGGLIPVLIVIGLSLLK